MSVDLKPVTSSAVEAIGHDPATNILHVRYKGGAVYAYPDVGAEHHADLMRAPSIGAHLNTLTRGRKGVRQ